MDQFQLKPHVHLVPTPQSWQSLVVELDVGLLSLDSKLMFGLKMCETKSRRDTSARSSVVCRQRQHKRTLIIGCALYYLVQ